MLAQLNGDEISVNINRAKYETNELIYSQYIQGQAHHWGAHLPL